MRPGRSPSMADLPDGALECVLGALEVGERHRTAALVCKRWWHAANRPPLLHTLCIRMLPSYTALQLVARLQSLAEWMAARAAPHVRALHLDVKLFRNVQHHEQQACHDAALLLAAMLAACGGAHGQLRELRLSLDRLRLPVNSWLAPLAPSLQTLEIACSTDLAVSLLPPLPALEELSLSPSNHRLTLHAAVRLPPSLTSLRLAKPEGGAFLQQVGKLSSLANLALRGATCSSADFAPLTRLGSLRRLDLKSCHNLPACLPQLTALEALNLTYVPVSSRAGSGTVLRQALTRLTGLTALALSGLDDMAGPPDELAGLPQLRRFAWLGAASRGAGEPLLPGGAWLGRLERLVGPSDRLVNCQAELAAATQLEQLGVDDTHNGEPDEAEMVTIIRCMQRHPSLRRLVLENMLGVQGLNTVMQAQRCRATPLIEFSDDVFVDVWGEI